MIPRLAALALAAATLAPAADADFDAIVGRIEARYGVHRMRIPFMGLANFVVKVGRPGGAKDVKLAVFENFAAGDADFHGTVAESLGSGWQPLVQVRSARETTSIYVRAAGRDFKMFIAGAEPHETTLMQLKLSQKAMRKWFEDPPAMARTRRHDR